MSGLLWPCLPLGLLGMSPAQVALACRSQEGLIPPRSYLYLGFDPGPHTCIGLFPSLGVGVLGVGGTNHVTQRPARGGTGLVPSGGTYLSSGLLHLVRGVKALQGPSLLRPGVVLVGLRLFHPFHGTRLRHLGLLGVVGPRSCCTHRSRTILSLGVQGPVEGKRPISLGVRTSSYLRGPRDTCQERVGAHKRLLRGN